MPPSPALPDTDVGVETDGIGPRLREARQRARLSTRDVAERAQLSAGFISQVENGKRGVSIAVLKRLSETVGLSVAELLSDKPLNAREVLRAADRPHFTSDTGITKLLLSRTPLQQLEVYLGIFEVGGSTGDEPYSHDHAQEMFHVLSGTIEFTVGGVPSILHPGDTLEYLSTSPHRAANIGDTIANAIWITSHFTAPIDPTPTSARPRKGTTHS